MNTTTILIADDHEFARKGLRSLLGTEQDFEIVGEAATGQEALKLCGETKPDIVLMDITMQGMDGISTTKSISKEYPQVKVIGLSMHKSAKIAAQMLAAGARGYLVKDSPLTEITMAIRTIINGETFVSSTLAEATLKEQEEKKKIWDKLSRREKEVLRLVTKGMTSKEASVELSVTEKTISFHRQNIMSKLGLSSVAELTKYALLEGLTTLDL